MRRFGLGILLMGVILSATAAYYSVYGLAQLFAGAFVAVLILGGVLEVAKLVLAASLHQYWRRLSGWMKPVFVAQLLVLMLITSIGIFGFLTNGYIQQKTTSAPQIERVATINGQIAAERETIAFLEKEREALNSTLSTASEAAATAAAYSRNRRAVSPETLIQETLRGRQTLAPEFERISSQIRAAQTRIESLTIEKVKAEGAVSSAEAKIGPLKYAALMLFGSDDAQTTDMAVRTLILLLMFVFDPLAVCLVVFGSSLMMRSTGPRTRMRKLVSKEEAPSEPKARTTVIPEGSNVTSFADLTERRTTAQKRKRAGPSKLRRPAIQMAA